MCLYFSAVSREKDRLQQTQVRDDFLREFRRLQELIQYGAKVNKVSIMSLCDQR